MCGINLIYNFGRKINLKEKISLMNNSISYRGPDQEGYFLLGNAALGHKRLSIIDLTKKAKQPMQHKDWIIIFNGEIYNFMDIRKELKKKGHLFESKSDTEVILHAFEAWKERCLEKFNGMFAFAIYNLKTDEIFVARDRVGIKPIVYSYCRDYFALSSEIKAISCLDFVSKKIDYTGLNYYLSFGFIPAPFTIYKDIKKLEPGHYLIVRNGKIIKKRYWSPFEKSRINYDYAKKRLKSLVFDAVKIRLVSDVPIGVFLSGGIDSGIIASVMSTFQKPSTFTVGYQKSILDESACAELTAKKISSNHKTKFIKSVDLLKSINILTGQLNEPFSDQSFIPSYIVARETRKRFTVALSGDGADELFAGYNKYLAYYYSRYYSIMRLFSPLIKMLPASRKNRTFEMFRKLKRLNSILDKELINMAYNSMLIFSDSEKKVLIKSGYFDCMKIMKPFFVKNDPNSLLVSDFHTILPSQMLFKVDSASMLNSLEVRVPFLDHRIVELVLNLPFCFKMRGKKRKIILKDSFGYMLDKKILKKHKQGFDIPIGEWIKGDLKNRFLDSLECITLNKLVDTEQIKRLYNKHLNNAEDNSNKLWNIFILSEWLEKNPIRL